MVEDLKESCEGKGIHFIYNTQQKSCDRSDVGEIR